MKYNKNAITNLIILLVVISMVLFSVSCSNDEQITESSAESQTTSEESSIETTSEISEIEIELPLESALDLLIRDRLITEIFLCNKLCHEEAKTNVGEFQVEETNAYYEFSAIEKLLNNTYKSESEIEFFLSYPNQNNPSVFEKDGKTYVFNHSGSGYDDFVDVTTVSIEDSQEDEVKLIKAKTISGKEIEFKALWVDEKWYLEKGIVSLNPAVTFDGKSENHSKGTFSKLNGKILAVELYLTDAESEFDPATEEIYHNKIVNALNFAVSQAKDLGAEIEITYDNAYFDHRNIIENNSMAVGFVFQGTGFGSIKAFVESNFDVSQYDGYVVAVCLNKEFDNYVYVHDETEEDFAEYFVVGNDTSEKQIYSSTLELLGDEIPEDEYLKSLYDFYFPQNVSLCDDYSASVMSCVTAYNCGIIDNLDNIYSIFYKQSEEVEDGE